MAEFATDWSRGPIGPGWLMMFAPVSAVRASGGGGSVFAGFQREKKKKKKPKNYQDIDEAIALFLLMREQ